MKSLKEKQKMPGNDPVDEYFKQTDQDSNREASELFEVDDNLEPKTDINENGISIVNAIMLNDDFLKSKKLFKSKKTPFKKYIDNYLKLRISKNRLGRGEFVDSIKDQSEDDTLNKLSEFQNVTKSKN